MSPPYADTWQERPPAATPAAMASPPYPAAGSPEPAWRRAGSPTPGQPYAVAYDGAAGQAGYGAYKPYAASAVPAASSVLPPSEAAAHSGSRLRALLTVPLHTLVENRKLLFYCTGWYMCSSVTSTLNKAILNDFPQPMTVTLISFLLTVVISLAFGYVLPFTKPHQPSKRVLRTMLPYSICRIVNHSLATLALSLMPVSLMHTVKAISPLFTVALSRLLLRKRVSWQVLASLVPICGGILLACATDIEFQLGGAVAASISVLAVTFQAILSKGIFTNSDLTEFSLLFYSSLTSAVLMMPFWFFAEGAPLLAAAWNGAAAVDGGPAFAAAAAGLSLQLLGRHLLAGLAQYLHGVFAFSVVAEATELTYSVASVVKRVVVIAVSILWLGARVNPLSLLGALITFSGVFLYNEAVRRSRQAAHRADGKAGHRRRGIGLGVDNGTLPTISVAGSPTLPQHYDRVGRLRSLSQPPSPEPQRSALLLPPVGAWVRGRLVHRGGHLEAPPGAAQRLSNESTPAVSSSSSYMDLTDLTGDGSAIELSERAHRYMV